MLEAPRWSQRNWAKIHRGWIVPLVLIVAIIIANNLLLAGSSTSGQPLTYGGLFTGLLNFVLLIGLLAALVFLIIGIVGLIRAMLRSRGIYTKRERRELENYEYRLKYRADARLAAGRTLEQLLNGQVPQSFVDWSIPFDQDEAPFARAQFGYARFYGTDAQWTSGGLVMFGGPMLLAGSLLASAAVSGSNKNRALREAAEQWREGQLVDGIITNRRFIAIRADGEVLSFWYEAISQMNFSLDTHQIILRFHDTAPLFIEGDDTDVLAVYIVAGIHGDNGLRQHPELEPIRSAYGQIAA
ncbi:MAG: hypothetical protein ACTHXA_07240 [Gulosibacter sp.]|uniref:hypothetical protein n=1 Tax=Gulosibacter sp. TaxID=2817531 RepID=UPI003F928EDC